MFCSVKGWSSSTSSQSTYSVKPKTTELCYTSPRRRYTMSLTTRVYLYLFSSCCLPYLRILRKFGLMAF